jgi:hypothetical protein
MSVGKLSGTNGSNGLNLNQASFPSAPKPRNNGSDQKQATSPAYSSSSNGASSLLKDRFIAAKEDKNTKHALEEIQNGGKAPDLSVLIKNLKSFQHLGSNANCDTGEPCGNNVTYSC